MRRKLDWKIEKEKKKKEVYSYGFAMKKAVEVMIGVKV